MTPNEYSTADKKKMISGLQKLAAEVLKLKSCHRQKRPIVIEFSGSPKSGKTSCINSLELFLKRNGFKVEIVHERASVCPVYDKHSPMFNLWTSCMSISRMIGVLEQKEVTCDVLILDRGVFDAFCWFNWLANKKMLEKEQLGAIESFFLMDSITNRIDLVFAFCAKPEISIKREYATLLTDKPGTIMNTTVLTEYLNSIDYTIEEKKKHFHNDSVFKIDTSDKSQDEVGKEVTETTLTALKNLLMERIGYIENTPALRQKLQKKRWFNYSELSSSFAEMQFDLRENVENDSALIQPIPIAVITNPEHDRVLTIKKKGSAVTADSPEKDKLLLYVGGHTRFEDYSEINSQNFLSICKYTLRREVKEELGISLAFNEIEPIFLYTPDVEKSAKHLGVCFIVEYDDLDSLHFHLDSVELIQNTGTSKSGRFQDIDEMLKDKKNSFESWSLEILKNKFNATWPNAIDIEQMTLFDYDYIKL
jgi:predicted NUDIX family phosphoesterase